MLCHVTWFSYLTIFKEIFQLRFTLLLFNLSIVNHVYLPVLVGQDEGGQKTPNDGVMTMSANLYCMYCG